MLSEEALIVLAAFGACGLLVLGVLELLWPTRPRHPVRRRAQARPSPPAPARAARPHRQGALARHGRGRTPAIRRVPPLTPSPVPLAPLPSSIRQPPAARTPALGLAGVSTPVTAGMEPVVANSPAMPTAATEGVTAAETVAPERFLPDERESVVERCFALYQQQRHAEVIERAADALTAAPDGTPLADAQAKAALWSVVALARQALGEDAEARAALESAIAVAPDGDRPTYQRQLASLAESVGRGLLAEAQRHASPESEDCLAAIRSAVAWLERGAAAAPADAPLAELVAGGQAMLWPAWERTVMALLQRQDYRNARRLLREAMADARFPAGRAETFREMFSGTFSGEVGQLTAQAIRSMQDARESDALASLQRAETLLDTLDAEALPAARREEVDRRLWWGYNKLGARRVEAAGHEAALEPLFHALAYDVGPARRQETVALLVRALDGLAAVRALAIRERAEAGDREAALVQCDKLWALLRSATGMGLAESELAATFGKVQRLFESLGRHPS